MDATTGARQAHDGCNNGHMMGTQRVHNRYITDTQQVYNRRTTCARQAHNGCTMTHAMTHTTIPTTTNKMMHTTIPTDEACDDAHDSGCMTHMMIDMVMVFIMGSILLFAVYSICTLYAIIVLNAIDIFDQLSDCLMCA